MSNSFELVRLTNGTFSIRSLADGETFHPVAGPVAEAEELYVRQLRLRERVPRSAPAEFVVWDVGLGAGGNALTAIRNLVDAKASLHVVSFDYTLEALRFAVSNATALQFPVGFEEPLNELLGRGRTQFQHGQLKVIWTAALGDFPTLLASRVEWPTPDAIFFDAYSPPRNPEMWTRALFQNLFQQLNPDRPCSLATFSRSTMARVAMLLAGFFVGAGEAIAGKEETTIAANRLELLPAPLDARWRKRVKVSRSAEPLSEPPYRQAPMSEETWAQLVAHPQFR